MFYLLSLARDRTGYIDWKRPSGAGFQPIDPVGCLAGTVLITAPVVSGAAEMCYFGRRLYGG